MRIVNGKENLVLLACLFTVPYALVRAEIVSLSFHLDIRKITKWSTKLLGEDDFADYYAYADAASFELPTIEQVEELANYCRWQADRSSSGLTFWGATCIGKNGKQIYIRSWGYKEGDKLCAYGYGRDTVFFWIRNEEEGDDMKAIKLHNVKDEKPELEIVKLFSGDKLPILLVQKK